MSLMPLTQDRRAIAVGTPLGEDKLVATRMRVTEQLGRPFEIELTVRSQDPYVDPQKIIGQNVTIRLALDDQARDFRYFNGYVARFRTVEEDPRLPRYQMTVVPFLWFLGRTTDCRAWQDVAVPDIVTNLIKERGFTDISQDLTFTGYPKREFCVQYRETVLDYVSRLMEEEGIYYVFNHEDGKHTMVLVDGPEAHANVGTLNYRKTGGAVGRKDFDLVTDWALEYEVQSGGYTLLDYDFKKPKNKLQGSTEAAKQHDQSTHERLDYPGGFVAGDEGDRLSRVRLEELQAGFEIARGQTTARNLAAGSIFTLAKHPLAANNKDWLVTSLDIQVEVPETFTTTSAGAGMSFDCWFTAIPSQTPYRPARVTPVPLISGPQPAIVVGPSGEEIHTDEFGRVRVRFYWDVRSDNNERSSCWIRVAQPAAGKKWGGLFLPRVGMEVIVEFVNGDPDQPLVTGCVYNGANGPPYALPQFKTISTIKSSSSKGGDGFNEIRIEDKKGEEQIFIHAQHRMDQRVRGNLYETNYGNREVRVGWESDNGDSGGNFNILVKNDLNQHIKGNQYETVDKDHNITVSGDVVEDLQKNLTTKVKQTAGLNAQTIILQGSDTISHNANQVYLQGSQVVNVKGANVNVEGAIGVSLKAGGNFVVINQAGVSINGTLVQINSGGAAQAAQDAKQLEDVTMKEPLDALAASQSHPGELSSVQAASPHHVRANKVKTLFLQQPPPIPSPHIAKPPFPRSLQSVSDGGGVNITNSSANTCLLRKFAFSCEHGGRPCNADHELWVVPSASGDSLSLEVQVENGGLGCIHYEVVGPDGATKTYPGSQRQLKIGGWSVRGGDRDELSALVDPPYWAADPKTYSITAIGKNGTISGLIKAYPADTFRISLSLESERLSKQLKKVVGPLADKVAEWTGIQFDPLKELTKYTGGGFYLCIDPPEVTVNATAEWKELKSGDDYWKTWCSWSVSIATDPLLSIRLRWDLGFVGIAAIAPELEPVWELLVKYLNKGRPPFYLEGFVKVDGELGWKREEPEGVGNPHGKATIQFGPALGLEIRNGVLSAECRGEMSASGTIETELGGDQLVLLKGSINLGQVMGTAKIQLDTGEWFHWKTKLGYDKKFEFFKGETITLASVRILPRSDEQ